MSFQDFSLVPADDPQSSPSDDLAASVQGALALGDTVQPITEDAPVPFGRSWDFDWEAGQFRRVGQSPAEVTGFDTLGQWCEAALHSARFAHPIFSDEFGMEEPDDVIGEFPDGEAIADWQRSLVDALMVHDRVTSVENVSLTWDPTTGILTVDSLDVVTDDEETLTVADITLQAGGP